MADDRKNPSMGGFELVERIGEGGSGVVHRVRDAAGAEFALKVLKSDATLSEHERTRFREEAERMQRVVHESVVALVDIGEAPDGSPWICMPLLEGETLAKRLARGPLDPADATRIVSEIGSGLEAIHAAGMLHRDIKPENVFLIAPEARAVILDFGIARDIDGPATTTTREGRTRGTPAYMAPERFFGAPATVASEVYELAVTLYLMLVGGLPWSEERAFDERLNPVSPIDRGVEVPGHVNGVIMRALSTRPEARPSSVIAFVEALEAPSESSFEGRQTEDVSISTAPPRSIVASTAQEAPSVEPGVTRQERDERWPRASSEKADVGAAAHVSEPWRSSRGLALGALGVVTLVAIGWFGTKSAASPALEARAACLEPSCFSAARDVPASRSSVPDQKETVSSASVPTVRAASDGRRRNEVSPRAVVSSVASAPVASGKPDEGDAKYMKDRR